jgi:hypothetical protein
MGGQPWASADLFGARGHRGIKKNSCIFTNKKFEIHFEIIKSWKYLKYIFEVS